MDVEARAVVPTRVMDSISVGPYDRINGGIRGTECLRTIMDRSDGSGRG